MYNRYIPQPDGTYRRRQVQEPRWQTEPKSLPNQPEENKEEPCPPVKPPNQQIQECKPRTQQRMRRAKASPARSTVKKEENTLLDFFHKLLPEDFDTGDLLIVLLLLLMSGDCQEDQNSALLTLVIYLFL